MKSGLKWCLVGVLCCLMFVAVGCDGKKAPITTLPFEPSNLRGFNLQSKILVGDWVAGDADEWAFQFMADEGFNFARIPMEVDQIFTDQDYSQWNEAALMEMDRIIALGQKYHILILLDLHTLPGIRPSALPDSDSRFNADERLAIWKDIFQVISKRYQDVPSSALCYNLINEPYAIASDEYMKDISEVREVIRQLDQTKVLFIDPNNWAGGPMYNLLSFEDPYLIATPHFYQPFLVTHYLAEWVDGAASYPVPEYPSIDFNGFLYGSGHPELQAPLTFNGHFSAGDVLKVRIHEISDQVHFQVNTENEALYQESFQTNDDASVWKEVHFNEEWQIYQNVYDQEVQMKLTQDASQIKLQVSEGDWLNISSITLESQRWEQPFQLNARSFDWGVETGTFTISEQGKIDFTNSSQVIDKAYLYEHYFKEWAVFQRTTKIPVVACEFGVYNKTNHQISLKVLEDNLALFKENNFGFALWNFSGPFGIFDSDREEVTYELYNGRKLDRQMLELLKKY